MEIPISSYQQDGLAEAQRILAEIFTSTAAATGADGIVAAIGSGAAALVVRAEVLPAGAWVLELHSGGKVHRLGTLVRQPEQVAH